MDLDTLLETATEHHEALRAAVQAAEIALGELEAGERKHEPKKPVIGGPRGRSWETPAPAPTQEPARARRIDPEPLREAWDVFRPALTAHQDTEASIVYRGVARIAAGDERLRSAVTTSVSQMFMQHEKLRAQAVDIRAVLHHAAPVRREFLNMLAAFERHMQAEELELYPTLVRTGDEGFNVRHTPSPVARTGDDVMRQLRSREARVIEEPGLLGRMKRWMKKG